MLEAMAEGFPRPPLPHPPSYPPMFNHMNMMKIWGLNNLLNPNNDRDQENKGKFLLFVNSEKILHFVYMQF